MKHTAKASLAPMRRSSTIRRRAGRFDDYLRGWIGTSKSYPCGVIHFAPAVVMEQFDRGFDTLQMFARLEGTGDDTVIRGFCRLWEERIGAILSASLGGKD